MNRHTVTAKLFFTTKWLQRLALGVTHGKSILYKMEPGTGQRVSPIFGSLFDSFCSRGLHPRLTAVAVDPGKGTALLLSGGA